MSAIADYLECDCIETVLLSQNLPVLGNDAQQGQHQEIALAMPEQQSHVFQQAQEAVADYLTNEAIEVASVENLENFTQQFRELLAPKIVQTASLHLKSSEQLIRAFAEYIEQQSIEAVLIENLVPLTKQLNQLTQKPSPNVNLSKSTRLQQLLPGGDLQALRHSPPAAIAHRREPQVLLAGAG